MAVSAVAGRSCRLGREAANLVCLGSGLGALAALTTLSLG